MLMLFLTWVEHEELYCRERVGRIAVHGAQEPPVRTISRAGNKAKGDKLSQLWLYIYVSGSQSKKKGHMHFI